MTAPIGNDSYTNSPFKENTPVKKSTFNNLQKGLVAAIAVATFFGGYAIGTIDDNSNSSVFTEGQDGIISEIENQPTSAEPSQVPTQQSLSSSGTNIIPLSIGDDPVKGDPEATVTVIEFSDFQCPFCARFTSQTLPQIMEDYVDTGKIKIVFKDLPLRIHSNARAAHIAAECADEHGKFWEYHDFLFLQQNHWQGLSDSALELTFTNAAYVLGIDREIFQKCMKSQEITGEVQLDTLEAASNEAIGTPTFFIGNEKNGYTKVVGAQPYSVFQRTIENYLDS